ncbi:tRNA pseudouridine(55) synthase TruB [Bacillus solimangrovi]|uniref:tRNA pseudouridine synthase B n=1 Tax=Bacillus solimangrovi TaxID=1305675 RepID=A0A1E5LDZ2_9BACI|nr:tRNA pseudouridine(55) synthase TruB [Bacillus solimangrovi]OEH92315.1 tRNA pseudouridine(55) synthase TruB [Bacillus solimangrovi]
MDGILPLYKPRGMTSHDCVFKVRKLLKTKKVGHTGTLDPEVDGVLPLCIGRATKIAEYITESEKEYEAEITLGTATETEDAHGDIIESKAVAETIAVANIEAVLKSFIGDITQIPPMYSAVKVNGKKLYEYARQGIAVERPERTVTIHDITMLSNDPVTDKNTTFSIRVTCSKGTYVRTLAVDIGKALGYPAHMSKLTRHSSGGFQLEDCVTFDKIEMDNYNLIPMEVPLSKLTKLTVNETLEKAVKNGAVLPIAKECIGLERFGVWNTVNECIAIYKPHPSKPGVMKPEKVLRI